MKYLKIYLTSFTIFLEILKKKSSEKKKKKKKKKKSSENDQSTGHFQSFFIYLFSVPPTLDLKKKSCKSTNKNNLALVQCSHLLPIIILCVGVRDMFL